jgi:hypothetical protein
MKGLTTSESFKRVPKLQSQLNALLNCKMRQHHIGRNGLVISTYMLLLKDSLVMYPMLNVGVIGMIDQVFKMRKKDAQRVLEVYTLFVKETEALINLYDISKSFTNRLPPIHPAKTTLVDVLNAHISKLEDDHDGGVDHQSGDQTNGDGGFEEGMGIEDHLMTTNHSATTPSSAASNNDGGDDSDTSSESSGDEDVGFGQTSGDAMGTVGGFDFAFTNTNGGVGGGVGNGNGNGNARASVGPNSFAFLTSQPSQPIASTSQGWDIFDRSFATSPSLGSVNGGGGVAANDPFAAFTALSTPQSHQQPTSASDPSLPYQDRVATVKANLSSFYQQQSPPPQQHQQDNPFGMNHSSSAASLSSPNPFAPAPQANPFSSNPAPATTTAPASNTGSYNPFL